MNVIKAHKTRTQKGHQFNATFELSTNRAIFAEQYETEIQNLIRTDKRIKRIIKTSGDANAIGRAESYFKGTGNILRYPLKFWEAIRGET